VSECQMCGRLTSEDMPDKERASLAFCPGCGQPARIVGRTTLHYEPIEDGTGQVSECLTEIDELRKRLKAAERVNGIALSAERLQFLCCKEAIEQRNATEAQLGEMRQTLLFYANDYLYDCQQLRKAGELGPLGYPILDDKGQLAREALGLDPNQGPRLGADEHG
jgi:hypothetical protein